MSSQRLWRLVRTWNLKGDSGNASLVGSRLGPWAATVCKEDQRLRVIAIDAGTHLTVAFPLTSQSAFHPAFADAAAALTDLGVDSQQIEIEAAAVKTLPLRHLRHAGLRERLEMVEFMCGPRAVVLHRPPRRAAQAQRLS